MPVHVAILPIMLTLCLMLLVTYYAFNYAGIISLGLMLPSFCKLELTNMAKLWPLLNC